MNRLPITDADLQAYVDAALPAARRNEVEAYLAAHPQDAERIGAYLAQKEELRALFDPVLAESLPEHLGRLASPPAGIARNLPDRSLLAQWWLQRIAASLVIALLGGLAGWMAHESYPTTQNVARMSPMSLPRQAAVAHAVFSPDMRRPVEITAEHEEQLIAWLSKRLGTPMRPPRLGALGYELVGGRLLPGDSGPVAQFMYQDADGQRLTLYVSTDNAANQDTAFRFAREGSVNVFYWIDGRFGYALSSAIDKGSLARVATAVYDQIERK